jgi:hypothetical protein
MDVLAAALAQGLAAHVDFLEVYEADVVNAAMRCELETVESHWTGVPTAGCAALPKPPLPHCQGSACM